MLVTLTLPTSIPGSQEVQDGGGGKRIKTPFALLKDVVFLGGIMNRSNNSTYSLNVGIFTK